jgi:hypothetical protein
VNTSFYLVGIGIEVGLRWHHACLGERELEYTYLNSMKVILLVLLVEIIKAEEE